MPDCTNYSHRSYVKNILIEIPNYRFHHQPLTDESSVNGNGKYVGREKIEIQFRQYLEKGCDKGAYLVSGFRGMGKTSFVRKVVGEYTESEKKRTRKHVHSIKLSFAQSEITERDILKQLIQELINVSEEHEAILIQRIFTPLTILIFILSLTLLFLFGTIIFDTNNQIEVLRGLQDFTSIKNYYNPRKLVKILASSAFVGGSIALLITSLNFFNRNKDNLSKILKKKGLSIIIIGLICFSPLLLAVDYFATISIAVSLAVFLFIWSYYSKDAEIVNNYLDLKTLQFRSTANTREEDGIETSSAQYFPFFFTNKRSKEYPVFGVKEIENELIRILNNYKNCKFIIIFDELDKVDVTLSSDISTSSFESFKSELNSYNKTRERRLAVINILASLKYFITEAKAKFIFIAGREMFDAALADVADRQNFIGSIFHHVIYVDSFLKDESNSPSAGLSSIVEIYLSRIFLEPYLHYYKKNKAIDTLNQTFLKNYFEFLKANHVKGGNNLEVEDALKVIYALQNFILYLTYRFNGSPKKLSKLIEEHITLISADNKSSFKNIVVKTKGNSENSTQKLTFVLSYQFQYRIGFITYLVRPFFLSFSSYAKRLSDNILVSIPFLLDHIIKFHPFAFSVQNLELLPEVIATNRNPYVRDFVIELIDYLKENHLSQTEMGLFDYKFIKRTANEIAYLSQVFEDESAAFNFSLDEMYAIKLYLYSRIKEVQDNQKSLNSALTEKQRHHSISLLYSLLGDVHYFDQEYDTAIVSYLDSLSAIDKTDGLNDQDLVVSRMRLKLKVGLLYERIQKYDMAIAYYNDAINFYLELLEPYLLNDPRLQGDRRHNAVDENRKHSDEEGGLKDLNFYDSTIHLLFQAFVSTLSVLEKSNIHGVSNEKLVEITLLAMKIGKNKFKNHDSFLQLSDLFNDIGALMFFKNNVILKDLHLFSKLVDHPYKDLEFHDVKEEDLIKELVFLRYSVEHTFSTKVTHKVKDYRPALTTIGYYKISLENLLNAKRGSRLIRLLAKATADIVDYTNEYHANYLSLMAFTLSSIGDYLLSVLVSQQFKLEYIYNCSVFWEYLQDIQMRAHRLLLGRYSVRKYERVKFLICGLLDFHSGALFGKENAAIITEILLTNNQENFLKLRSFLNSEKIRPMKFWDIISKEYFFSFQRLIFNRCENDNCHRNHKTGPENKVFWENVDCNITDQGFNNYGLEEIELIIFNYYVSGRYYSKAGITKVYSLQLRKIMETLFNVVEIEKIKIGGKRLERLLKFLESTVLAMTLEASSWTSSSTDRPQMYKFKYYEGLENLGDSNGNRVIHPRGYLKHNYLNLSNNPDVKEALLNFALLNLKFKSLGDFNEYSVEKINKYCSDNIEELNLISQYGSVNNQHSRILEMNLNTRINRVLIKKILDGQESLKDWESVGFWYYKSNDQKRLAKFKINTKDDSEALSLLDFLCELVASSVFNLIHLLKSLQIFGINPVFNYSHMAYYNKRMGRWLKYHALCRHLEIRHNGGSVPEEFLVDVKINKLFGSNTKLIGMDATSQFQLALQNLHKAKEYHSNGKTYHKELAKRIYLEGDYEDHSYHFAIAIERQRINSGKIRAEIRNLEKEMINSPLYKYSSFTDDTRPKL